MADTPQSPQRLATKITNAASRLVDQVAGLASELATTKAELENIRAASKAIELEQVAAQTLELASVKAELEKLRSVLEDKDAEIEDLTSVISSNPADEWGVLAELDAEFGDFLGLQARMHRAGLCSISASTESIVKTLAGLIERGHRATELGRARGAHVSRVNA